MTSMRSYRFSKWLKISFAFSVVLGFSLQARAQNAPAVYVGRVKITGIPDDWTHHHVVFANPGTEEEVLQSGHDVQWQKIVNEPRYVIQQLKKHLPVQGPASADAEYRARWIFEATGDGGHIDPFRFGTHNDPFSGWPIEHAGVHRDWSMTSGAVGGLLPNHYPAKYGFLDTSVESCNDFVVFPTGVVGTSTQATVIAYKNLYVGTCGATVPGILLSINTGGLANTSPVLSFNGDQVAYVQTTSSGSVTATLNSTVNFTVTTGALVSSDVGSVVSGTGIPVGDTIATVGSATAGTLTTAASATRSSTLTITGIAQLVLLKIGTGGGTAVSGVGGPLSPTVTTAANYRTCTGPCYTTFNFYNATAGTAPGDSNSAPFYVYNANDVLYVGDNLGYVHKFTGVFDGTPPAEVTAGWPAHASTETSPILNSPIFDSVSDDIFVGDASGYLHQFAVGTTPGTVNTSGRLAYNTGGLVDPPIIDSSSGTDYVYQFVGYSDDTAPTHDRPSYINRFAATSALTGFGTSVWFPNNSGTARPAGTATIQYAGTFDNTYFAGTGNTGNIYSCADGVLYQIPLATINNATPTVNTFSTPTSGAATCSPVSEFYNAGTDWIFMSVESNGNATVSPTCAGACVYNYNVTTSTNITGSPVDGLSATNGTSGIVIDNAASGGGSEIYFTSQGSETCAGNGSVGNGAGSCAVQATQSALH